MAASHSRSEQIRTDRVERLVPALISSHAFRSARTLPVCRNAFEPASILNTTTRICREAAPDVRIVYAFGTRGFFLGQQPQSLAVTAASEKVVIRGAEARVQRRRFRCLASTRPFYQRIRSGARTGRSWCWARISESLFSQHGRSRPKRAD